MWQDSLPLPFQTPATQAITARADPRPFYSLWHHKFNRSGRALSANLRRMKRCFKLYQNEHDLAKETGEKVRKACNYDQNISMKILFHYHHLPFLSSYRKILKAFLKRFPPNCSPFNTQQTQKRTHEKRKKRGREKAKCKRLLCHLWTQLFVVTA